MSERTENPSPTAKKSVWRWLLRVLLVLFVLIGGFLGYLASQPDDYRVERSQTIAATPAAVFRQVNDFHLWEAWSPWAKLDPQVQNRFEGPESGEGAAFYWSGNQEVGVGSMLIQESQPDQRIVIRLQFEQPMQDTSVVEFTFQPQGDQTTVTWSMTGRYPNWIGKAICKIMNMDKMIGSDFEKGLANLKRTVESSPPETTTPEN